MVEQRPEMRTAVVATSHRVGAANDSLAALTTRLLTEGDGKVGLARARLEREGGLSSTFATAELTTFTTVIDDRHLPLALWLAAIRMAVCDVSAESFTRTRDRLGAEVTARLKDDLGWHARTSLEGIALGDAPPPITLADVDLAEARAFHKSHFGPGRAALIIISPKAATEVLALVDKTVGAVRRPTAPIALPEPPLQTSRRASSLRSDGVHRAAVAYGWRIPARGHADAPALAVAAEVLGGGATSALHRELVVEKSWAFTAAAGVTGRAGANLLEAFALGPRHVQPIDLATSIQAEATQLGSDPRAIAAARKRLLRRRRAGLATPISRARLFAEHALYDGDASAALAVLDRIRAVTDEDVRRVARTHLTVDNASMVECFAAPIFLNAKEQAARDALEKQAREREEKEKKRRAKKGKKRPKKAPKGKRPKRGDTKKPPAPKKRSKKRSTKKPSSKKPSGKKPSGKKRGGKGKGKGGGKNRKGKK